jgi:hypothetical protein
MVGLLVAQSVRHLVVLTAPLMADCWADPMAPKLVARWSVVLLVAPWAHQMANHLVVRSVRCLVAPTAHWADSTEVRLASSWWDDLTVEMMEAW